MKRTVSVGRPGKDSRISDEAQDFFHAESRHQKGFSEQETSEQEAGSNIQDTQRTHGRRSSKTIPKSNFVHDRISRILKMFTERFTPTEQLLII
jgi:hypothetical protein